MNTTPDPAEHPDDGDTRWLREKRQVIVETLNGLISARQVEHTALAERLNWKPARLTRVLTGKETISINAIAQIVVALGVDFDLVIRESGIDGVTGGSGPLPGNAATTWRDDIPPVGRFLGMAMGIAGIIYLAISQLAIEALEPLMASLLGASVFMLARAQWQLRVARRDIKALKRYLKNRKVAAESSGN